MTEDTKRRHPRLSFGIRVFEEKDWMIRDLSPIGFFIETSEPLPEDTRLDLQFKIPLDQDYLPIAAKGIVRRRESGGMAVEFIDLEHSYYEALEKFVQTFS